MSSIKTAAPEAGVLREFFDKVAFRYDLLNRILSFQLDDAWRRRARDLVLGKDAGSILDLGVGTGKFLKLFLEKRKFKAAAGLDFSANMLAGAARELGQGAMLVRGDFHALPFASESFDLVISAFALRSVRDMPLFLGEVRRLLKPSGKIALLCLTRPRNPFFRMLYYPYVKFYLPLAGGILSGHARAYQFLSSSIMQFQEPSATARMMEESGFKETAIHEFTLGAATLIVAARA